MSGSWRRALFAIAVAAVTGSVDPPAVAATAGERGTQPLVVAENGKSAALILMSPRAGQYEAQAARDLQKYIAAMTGAVPEIVDDAQSIRAALAGGRPLLVVGQVALEASATVKARLAAVVKAHPSLRADGVALLRDGNKIFLAGPNDESHYFAVAELLRAWGVRWFMPGAFGECVPHESKLLVDKLDVLYAPPFEIRSFWVSWLGDRSGVTDFQLRNMMAESSSVPPAGHALGEYTKGLGKSAFDIPLTSPKTAEHVARGAEATYAAGKDFSLSMEDGLYTSDDPGDAALARLQWDKYSLRYSVTDAMLGLLNNVARRLREKYPSSRSKIGFLAYSNMFIPPVRTTELEPSLYGMLAPIDIDPVHGVGDARSWPKKEYGEILRKWAQVTRGRLTIYDYDQSMLIWRDVPNPSHQAFRQDVKAYRDAGILGVSTESRMALATTFTNLYLRGRLMWDPDANVEALLEDFYARFFGPARLPMRDYWSAIFEAWGKAIVTEHEYFLLPAIYTPELVDRLDVSLRQAEAALDNAAADPDHGAYADRIRFVRLGFDTLKSYVTMVTAASAEVDYAKAAAAGDSGLRARRKLTQMNPAFTTTQLEDGYPFWEGEVRQYRELLALTNGEKGVLLARLPLEWRFHRDPEGAGMGRGYLTAPIDLAFWRSHGGDYTVETRKDYPADQWEMIRTDLYIQAQGVRFPDQRGYTGYIWYRTPVRLSADQAAANPHIHFPGLFNACELYANGIAVARRDQFEPWWLNDYRFEWDVSLAGRLQAGDNEIALLCHNPHHMGGMFRRPFLYAPANADGKPGARPAP
jgi:hypothetical protein